MECLERLLGVERCEAVGLMERLASMGLARCHHDADGGMVCCASPTEEGLALLAASEADSLVEPVLDPSILD